MSKKWNKIKLKKIANLALKQHKERLLREAELQSRRFRYESDVLMDMCMLPPATAATSCYASLYLSPSPASG